MSQRRRLILLLLLALGIVIPATVVVGTMPVYLASSQAPAGQAVPTPSTTPSTAPEPECPVREPAHYYTFDANKESKNAYGPSVTATANMLDMRKLFERRVCGHLASHALSWVGGDWALFASLKSEVDGTDRSMRFDNVTEWASSLNDFLPRIQWSQASLFIDNRGNTKVDTYYMVRGDDYRPDVKPTTKVEPPSDYLILPVRRHDGTTVKLMLRTQCGFQPVRPHEQLDVLKV